MTRGIRRTGILSSKRHAEDVIVRWPAQPPTQGYSEAIGQVNDLPDKTLIGHIHLQVSNLHSIRYIL